MADEQQRGEEGKRNGRWEQDGGEAAGWPDSAGDIHWAEGENSCSLLDPTGPRPDILQFKSFSSS